MDQNNDKVIQQHLDIFEESSAPCGRENNNAEGMGGKRSLQKDEPATARQLRFLEKLGVEVTPNLTEKEASILIGNALLRRVA
jgi:hypothetical protein